MAIRARLLAIGDELTHGHLVDTNSPWLARQLETHGIHVECVCAIPDDPTLLTAAIREACMHAELVVATGGIGPTEDDRTRHCAAAAAGVTVDHDEASFQWIVERFRKINREMPPSNRRQALLPVGARPLRNDCGTAPGFQMLIGRAQFFALPGVPLEMQNMMMTQVLPDMRSRFGLRGALSCHLIHLVGPPEAVVGEAIAPFMAADRMPRVGLTAHGGLLTIRIASTAETIELATAAALATAEQIRPRIADHLVYEGTNRLADEAVQRLRAAQITVTAAESCTGGAVLAALTDVAQVSEILEQGFVTYANSAKVALLGVPEALLETHGAVSEETALAMAQGARARSGARLAVAVSGIAGPGGGVEGKPVGTVCFALILDGVERTWTRRFLDLGRAFIRDRAVIEVLAAIVRLVPASP